VIGGTLTEANGAVLESAGGTSDTIANVTLTAGSTFTGVDNSVTYLQGTIVYDGTIALDPTGDGTELRLPGGTTTTLTGGGIVSLSNNANNTVRDANDATGKLVNFNNTIEGAGNIGNGEMSLDNQAGATVDANLSSQLTIQPSSANVTNDGTFEATSGGLLNVVSGVIGSGQFVIGASSEVELGGASGDAATFTGTTGKLRIGNPSGAKYTGTIGGFSANDILELAGTYATSAAPGTFNGRTTSLIVTLSGGGTLTYTLAGNYSSDGFTVTHPGSDSDISVTAITSGDCPECGGIGPTAI
jgi:hypothetical protein